MNAKPAQISIKLARECMPLCQDARKALVLAHPNYRPTDSLAVESCCNRALNFERAGNSILWDVLNDLPPARFGIPDSFPCGIRYVTKLDCGAVNAVDCLRDNALSNFFVDPIYRNFAVRLALRAGYALSHIEAFADVFIAGGNFRKAPAVFDIQQFLDDSNSRMSVEVAPAAFDPDQFLCDSETLDALFPNGGTNSPEFLGE